MAGYLIHGFGDVGALCLAFSFCWGSLFLRMFLIQAERSLHCIGMKLQVHEKPSNNYEERRAGSPGPDSRSQSCCLPLDFLGPEAPMKPLFLVDNFQRSQGTARPGKITVLGLGRENPSVRD